MPYTPTSTPSDTSLRAPSTSRKPGRVLLIAVVAAAATLAGCQSTGGYSPSAEHELNRIANQR